MTCVSGSAAPASIIEVRDNLQHLHPLYRLVILNPGVRLLSLVTTGVLFFFALSVLLVTRPLSGRALPAIRLRIRPCPPPPFSTCAGLRRPPELNHYQRNLSLFCDNVSAERLDRRRSRGHVRLSHDKRPEAKQQREARASGRGGRWQGMRRSILPQLLTPPSCTANIPSPG